MVSDESIESLQEIVMKMMLMPIATLLTAGLFQAPSTAPLKLGLWEATLTTHVKQADGTDKVSNRVTRSCMTNDNWLTLMGPTAKDACPKANEVWTKDSYSFDVACSGKPKMASVAIHFDTPETEKGTIDFFGMPDGSPFTMHGSFSSHWVGAECGDVAPGSPVLIR
jgi:hypothetical protein